MAEILLFNPGECSSIRVLAFLQKVDDNFVVRLSSRVDLDAYSQKLSLLGYNIFAKYGTRDVAHAAFYVDSQKSQIFLSSIAVEKAFGKKGLGRMLLDQVINFGRLKRLSAIALDAAIDDEIIHNFYRDAGFELCCRSDEDSHLIKYL